MEFPLKTGESWTLQPQKRAELEQQFGKALVERELPKAAGWCKDNPRKRKTRRGMPTFLRKWLTRAAERFPVQEPLHRDVPAAPRGSGVPWLTDAPPCPQCGRSDRILPGNEPGTFVCVNAHRALSDMTYAWSV